MSMNDTHAQRQAADEAAQWRAKLDGDDAVEADWLAYEAWLATPMNRAAAAALDETLALALDADASPGADIIDLARRRRPPPAVWGIVGAALAAGVALAVWMAPENTIETTYGAPATSSRLVTLADGATVLLNRGAAMRVRYGRERHVTLERGEASFAVTHDPNRPFEVAAGDALIRDVGTEFNVARNPGGVVVTVRTGEVELRAGSAEPAHARAGEQARLTAETIVVSQVQADDAFAWKDGRLVYHDAPLATVVEDLNRYSATPIVVAADASRLQFSGALAIDTPQAMLARLQAFLPIRAERQDDRIVLRSTS